VFADEDQMREILIKWLESLGFIVGKSVHIHKAELDVVAYGSKLLTESGIKNTKSSNLYVFEVKIASTRRLVKELVEQAITRLLIADYIYMVVPRSVEVWVDDKTKSVVKPYEIVVKAASGRYSRILGILSVDPSGTVEVVRQARRSGLTIPELREKVVKMLLGTSRHLLSYRKSSDQNGERSQ